MSEAELQLYDWDDYRTWPDGQRWEIVAGQAFAMSPAPTARHQWILQELTRMLGNHFAGKTCRVFPAPTRRTTSSSAVFSPN